MLLGLDGAEPDIASTATVLPTATVIGAAVIGEHANLWYGCVVRADEAEIVVGEHTNLQDGVIVHADPGYPVRIGARVTVGHGAIVHGAGIEDDCLIGMRAVVLNGARIGSGCLLAAGTVVREGDRIPAGSMVAGVPGKVRRDLTEAERQMIQDSWRGYVDRAARHLAALTKEVSNERTSPTTPI
jgi:carbonic anhydrase/acetyltransferase-like protein (isoleucine patch superfamily)